MSRTTPSLSPEQIALHYVLSRKHEFIVNDVSEPPEFLSKPKPLTRLGFV